MLRSGQACSTSLLQLRRVAFTNVETTADSEPAGLNCGASPKLVQHISNLRLRAHSAAARLPGCASHFSGSEESSISTAADCVSERNLGLEALDHSLQGPSLALRRSAVVFCQEVREYLLQSAALVERPLNKVAHVALVALAT